MPRSGSAVSAARAGARQLARRRALPAAVGASLSLFAGASTAHAEEVFTAQAAAANAIASPWIPAPITPAAVCIVDTGVDPNPDTTNVVARLAVDGGDPGDVDMVGHHGTLMAMIASAPYNGFGMVGAAPSIKVVSVRAKLPGENGFYFSDVLKGVQMCKKYRTTYNIKVVSLSLGGQSVLDPETQALLKETVDTARTSGLSVVAAAGNHPGSADWPAIYHPVVGVAASDRGGALCAFSASGSAVDLSAPGCPQDVALPGGQAAWASGTSESAALVAAVLAQLRGLRPDLSPDGAEEFVMANAVGRSAGRVLDVEAAFRAAGLERALAAGNADRPTTSADDHQALAAGAAPTVADSGDLRASPVPAPSDPPSGRVPEGPLRDKLDRPPGRLPRPRLRTRRIRARLLELTLANRPRNARARIETFSRRPGASFPIAGRTLLVKADRVRTRLSGRLTQVSITYVDVTGRRKPSAALIFRP